MKQRILLILLWVVLICEGDGTSECYCSFSSDGDLHAEAEEKSSVQSKSETLAAAAGALSPLVVAGMGYGIWKLVTSKKNADSRDFMRANSAEPPEYTSRRGSNGSVSMLGTDDEITFSNSRTGSTVDLMRLDDNDPRNKPHPSHNWGSDSPYHGADIPGTPKPSAKTLDF